jgi:serine/threonine protein kinase
LSAATINKARIFSVHGKTVRVRGEIFDIVEFLGKGKSGYSYLIVKRDYPGERYVLKKIHEEPCAYYRFGDKLSAELGAYDVLRNCGIRIPRLIEYNEHEKYLVKEYIEGKAASQIVAQNNVSHDLFRQLFETASLASGNGLNIDYFPTNFISGDGNLTYIDYELNPYTEEWNLLNWGIYYWLNSEGMKEYLNTHNLLALNINLDSGIPIKKPFIEKARQLAQEFPQGY